MEGTSLIARATTTDVAGHERNEIVAKTQDKVEGEEEDMIERSTTDPFSLWWSLLLGLSTRVADARLQVRLRALETLQNVLCQYCNTIFTPKDWSIIFKSILFPLMDNVNKDITRQHVSRWPAENKFITTADSNSWIGTMGLPVLASFIDFTKCIDEDIRTTLVSI